MLGQLKAASSQAAALAADTAGSLKDVTQKGANSLKDATQKGSAVLQAKAGALNIKVPTVVTSASSSSLPSGDSQECGLTKRQRLYGAIGCYVFGALCGFLSTLMMWGGPKHLKQFAFFYTVGNLCSIGSSLFLVGPMRQFKVMCMPVRRVACCIWMGAMLLTLIIAFGFPKAGPLVLLLVIVQYAAMLWYGASFIPYGRAMLRKGCSKAASYISS
ncbi:hypothetical protein JM18_008082 [Phytophthora kernoviae]|uniref:Vesicle transport protein n=2 Tax=Phytophthora kernoviae TaxID=325452 RepID=A0A921V374_9STRA|nr:hypothetical protein G195_009925 [Phytophthora kernoviae 00238/432]KAG2510587.1 hypothetical protein JM18_008082 [Phytophthora kernoviae]